MRSIHSDLVAASRPLALVLVCVAAPATVTAGPQQPPPAVDVPSGQFPTIQSAIDGFPDGATIRIAHGTYRESLLVDRKQVMLVGVGNSPPTIVGVDDENGVITYSHGGGGTVRNLKLRDGAYGIAVADADAQIPTPGTTLLVDAVHISNTGRGIYGTFDGLEVRGSTITSCAWNGASVGVTGSLLIDGASFNGNKGVGLLLFNIVPPPGGGTRVIKDSYFVNNKGGGLHIRGGALPVQVQTSTVTGNTIFGIHLASAHDTSIYQCNLSSNKELSIPKPPPPAPEPATWGDGLRVFGSLNVTVNKSTLTSNRRAGLSVYGCADRQSHVELSDTALNLDGSFPIAFELDGFKDCTKPDGTRNPQTTPVFHDGGGNICDVMPCAAASSGVPMMPIGDPPK